MRHRLSFVFGADAPEADPMDPRSFTTQTFGATRRPGKAMATWNGMNRKNPGERVENIGNIWGNIWKYGKHMGKYMGNIWKNMGNIWKNMENILW